MTAPQARFVAAPVPAEVDRALARLAEAPDVARIAVMPDVHLAEEVCVGTVLATRRLVYPAAGLVAKRGGAPLIPQQAGGCLQQGDGAEAGGGILRQGPQRGTAQGPGGKDRLRGDAGSHE